MILSAGCPQHDGDELLTRLESGMLLLKRMARLATSEFIGMDTKPSSGWQRTVEWSPIELSFGNGIPIARPRRCFVATECAAIVKEIEQASLIQAAFAVFDDFRSVTQSLTQRLKLYLFFPL